ncbi:methyltransferase [Dasania sp. GY-MA-18]|uniref:Methyltransferase n=1 Tax=Dasania phycosphaerae TaxID=2950436 RepID=A0A9J6RQV9_9GAMM|nr:MULTISPECIES: methyltransferase [Dasania]MCR8924310.1 methyltransferase [Dasania sp. GY-MA-18]MCZ0866963.1 methyltransferase [Dasania phycosphaerae]MCZ0870467.1 methyltransferase [Dasania phycosphaerae]
MKIIKTFCLLASFIVSTWVQAGGNDEVWRQALTGEHRTPAYVQRDVYRHPQATLEFFAITPRSTVVEIWPGGGWYTEILAPLLKDQGLLYAAHFNIDSRVAYFRNSRSAFDSKLKANPTVYGKVVTTDLMPPQHVVIAPAASADAVLTFRNVHNWMKSGKADAVFAAMYQALKPGGVLGVVEHRAKPGTTEQAMIASGYVTEAKVKALAQQAGFEFVASSEINANPKDSANHSEGVWTLPPSLRLGDEQKAHYLAIGESDRMTLKFTKPK